MNTSVLTHTYAFLAYSATVGAWIYTAGRSTRLKLLLNRITGLPEDERIHALELVYGPITQSLSSADWVRERRNKFILIAFIVTAAALVPLIALSLVPPKRAGSLIADIFGVKPVVISGENTTTDTTDTTATTATTTTTATATTAATTTNPPTTSPGPQSETPEDVELGSPIDGTLERVVAVNTLVKTNTVVARIRRQDLSAEVAAAKADFQNAHEAVTRATNGGQHEKKAAQAEVDRATAMVNLAHARFSKLDDLFKKGSISAQLQDRAAQESAEADAALTIAKERLAVESDSLISQLELARATERLSAERLRIAEARMSMCDIVAPVDGTVIRAVRAGARVNALSDRPIVVIRPLATGSPPQR